MDADHSSLDALTVEVEAQGSRWSAYWFIDEDGVTFYLSDGARHVEISNAHEWQLLRMEAYLAVGEYRLACDLACERLKFLMQQRGEWPV